MSSLRLFARVLRPCSVQFPGFCWSLLLIILALATLCPRASALNLPLNWRWSNPSPHGNNIVEMIETNGVVVQVCDHGQIYSSVDFQDWISRDSHTTSS